MSRFKRTIAAIFRRLLPSWALEAKQDSNRREALFRESEITLVALVQSDWNRALLARIAKDHRWLIYFTGTSDEAWRLLDQQEIQIFLFEREAPDTDWRAMIRKVVSGPRLVCAILISEVTDDYLWNEVVMWGGHDVLVTPLREENVLRAVRLARLYWNSAMKTGAGVA